MTPGIRADAATAEHPFGVLIAPGPAASRLSRGTTAPPPSVTVAVCTYTERRWERLLACLASLRRQTVQPSEYLLVVDHNDALAARARAELADDIEILTSDGPRGISGARNTAIARATSDVILFLDDDATAEPDVIERLLLRYADPAVAGAATRAVGVWPSERPRWLPYEFDWVVGVSYRGLPKQASPVRNLIGPAMSFRRSALEASGPFDAGLGPVGRLSLSCEETELSIRLRAALPGSDLIYVPDAVVLHAVMPERTSLRYFFGRCYAEGRSKVIVAQRVGRRTGLASERAYAARTLPRGVLRELLGAIGGDWDAFWRAVMIVAGLTATVAGFGRQLATEVAARSGARVAVTHGRDL